MPRYLWSRPGVSVARSAGRRSHCLESLASLRGKGGGRGGGLQPQLVLLVASQGLAGLGLGGRGRGAVVLLLAPRGDPSGLPGPDGAHAHLLHALAPPD